MNFEKIAYSLVVVFCLIMAINTFIHQEYAASAFAIIDAVFGVAVIRII